MLIVCYIKYVSGKIMINAVYFLEIRKFDSGGIVTQATEVTGALKRCLRPLGHAILRYRFVDQNFSLLTHSRSS